MSMSRILQGIKYGLKNYPILTNAVIYGTMFVGAECTNQTLSKKLLTNKPEPYDMVNMKRCGIFGTLVQGPFMTVWYGWLDRTFSGTAAKMIATKVLLDQFTFTPSLYVLFFIFMSIVEQKPNVFEEMLAKMPQTFKISCCFWLPVQTFNFSIIPPIYRVTYMGFCAFIWVSILCWIKGQEY